MNENNSLSIRKQYPKEQFNLLIPIETMATISEIQSPVINAVKISTDLQDREIYEQEKAKSGGNGYPATPARYSLTKIALTRLAEAAGIKQVSSEPVMPSTCQKCATVNANSVKPVSCGQCGNKDVKYKVTISVPQLSGETLYFTDHHEINIEAATATMKPNQKAEFMKYLNQHCEAKALNGAIRTALQIRGSYLLEELKKPFVVAYLVPNMNHPDVKKVAIERMFQTSTQLFGTGVVFEPTVKAVEQKSIEAYEEPNTSYQDVVVEDGEVVENQPVNQATQANQPPRQQPLKERTEADRSMDFRCDKCDCVIPERVWNYSVDEFGQPLCYPHQREARKERRG